MAHKPFSIWRKHCHSFPHFRFSSSLSTYPTPVITFNGAPAPPCASQVIFYFHLAMPKIVNMVLLFNSFSPQPNCQVDFVFPNGSSSSSGINLNAKDVTLQPFPDAALTTISTTDTTTTTTVTTTTTTATTTTTTTTTTVTTTTTEDLGCNSNSSLCLGFDALCQVGQ